MAREKLSAGIEEVNGATSPGHIHRVKRFRDARGRIIGVGVQETYNVKHPRNWKKKPAEWYQEALYTFRCLCTYHDHAGTQSQSTKIAFFAKNLANLKKLLYFCARFYFGVLWRKQK